MIKPAGAATAIARLNTNSVRSNMERTITCPIWGLLYGGSSSVNDDGCPFKIVADSSLDTTNVIAIPKIITQVNRRADKIEFLRPPPVPMKNIAMIAIIVGNAPPWIR